MGKKIGIKLADGSFYPIMEDGIPGKKLMELTTVQDNQTAASIDVYRSESGTLEDAEYVDTLELSELIPHPGGEATLNFTIQLDEDNMLSVEVVDPESGKVIQSKSHLVNIPRNIDNVISSDETVQPLDSLPNVDLSDLDLDDFASVDSLPSGNVYPRKDEETSLETMSSEPDIESSNQDDNVSKDFSSIVDLPDFDDVSFDAPSSLESQDGDESPVSSEPDFEFSDLNLDDFQSIDDNIGDTYVDSLLEKDSTQEPIVTTSDYNLPDFNFENRGFDFGVDNEAVYEDSLPDFSKFELPDFYESEKNDFSFESESGLFTESDFQDPIFYTSRVQDSSNPLDFSGLYDDRETEYKQEKSRKLRGTVAVVICIACALICVGTLLFILFVIPNRLISPSGGDSVRIQTVTAEEMVEAPERTLAIEDTIVIMETPSVVPAPPPELKTDSEVTTYRVKWGDTLWDIAQSYYGNPWLYKKIAVVNNLPNPDRIVSGTVLTLPSF